MITKERAAHIWAQRGLQNHVGVNNTDMTEAEDRIVHAHWQTMCGSSSWMDAFFDFLNGRVLLIPQS